MAKAPKETKFLVSAGGTNFFYINRKNKKKKGTGGDKKLALRKYDPVLRKHVAFEEKKLSRKKKGAAAPKASAPKAEESK